MDLFAFVTAESLAPIFVFVAMVAGVFWMLTTISNRNSQAEERLERIGRPKSLADLDVSVNDSRQRFGGLKDAFSNLGAAMEPQSELEKNGLRVRLANAGFRSESAPAVFQGMRIASLAVLGIPGSVRDLAGVRVRHHRAVADGHVGRAGACTCRPSSWPTCGARRQKEIFLTLPDALDLLVVCVESGLGLDAAMRKVTDEMKGHAKVLCEELALANLQLQMGRPAPRGAPRPRGADRGG